MIYITQGHEKAIGLEVFLKSFLLLGLEQQKKISLVTFKDTLIDNLNHLGMTYSFNEESLFYNGSHLKVIVPKKNKLPQSTECLNEALSNINEADILLTLPTSKDQLIHEDGLCKGYTEYLRTHYKNANLCMVFKAFKQNTLLITDHIPLNEVSKTINKDLIKSKILTTLEYYKKYFQVIDEVIVSGINPHCGEGGLLGLEDKCIEEALKEVDVRSIGPVSGDTLHFYKNSKLNQLNVYMFHDQGLPIFKNEFKTIGLNITMGLPFIRMSVDHGTAFDIYGKGIADYTGCYYMLKEALKIG
jgi:4-hydroxythreonine-4-phosphate dehydrogenase